MGKSLIYLKKLVLNKSKVDTEFGHSAKNGQQKCKTMLILEIVVKKLVGIQTFMFCVASVKILKL
jgi:hypothetical protein